MYVLWFLFLFLTFVFSCKRTIWGIAFFVCSRILIPECVRLTPLADISLNTGIIIIVLMFSIRDILLKKTNWLNYYSLRCFIFIILSFIILLLSNYKDFNTQFNRLVQFSLTDIIPVVCLSFILRTKKDLILMLKVLFFATLISCVYGCFTLFVGNNPYVDMINLTYSSRKDVLDNIGLLNDGRGFYASSGTFEHANGWGCFLPITFAFFYYLNLMLKKYDKLFKLLLFLIIVCVIICSKRSAFISLLSFYFFLFIMGKSRDKMKILLLGIGLFLIVYMVLFLIPQLNSLKGFVESSLFFWDDSLRDKNDIGGSSFEMRVMQIIYPYYEIKENLLFGHGFGWSNLYISANGPHPIMYGFETILSSSVVDGGVLGLLLWIGMFYWSYRYSAKLCDNKLYCKLFTIVQLVIALSTGLGYFIYYGLYIVILNKFYLLKNENLNRDGFI